MVGSEIVHSFKEISSLLTIQGLASGAAETDKYYTWRPSFLPVPTWASIISTRESRVLFSFCQSLIIQLAPRLPGITHTHFSGVNNHGRTWSSLTPFRKNVCSCTRAHSRALWTNLPFSTPGSSVGVTSSSLRCSLSTINVCLAGGRWTEAPGSSGLKKRKDLPTEVNNWVPQPGGENGNMSSTHKRKTRETRQRAYRKVDNTPVHGQDLEGTRELNWGQKSGGESPWDALRGKACSGGTRVFGCQM